MELPTLGPLKEDDEFEDFTATGISFQYIYIKDWPDSTSQDHIDEELWERILILYLYFIISFRGLG